MEVLGYRTLLARLAPQAVAAEVETSLRRRPHITAGPVTYGRGDRRACEDFLKYGANDSEVSL